MRDNPFGLWRGVDIWESGGFPFAPRRTRILFYHGWVFDGWPAIWSGEL